MATQQTREEINIVRTANHRAHKRNFRKVMAKIRREHAEEKAAQIPSIVDEALKRQHREMEALRRVSPQEYKAAKRAAEKQARRLARQGHSDVLPAMHKG